VFRFGSHQEVTQLTRVDEVVVLKPAEGGMATRILQHIDADSMCGSEEF